MLISCNNSRKVEKLVIRAAAERFGRGKAQPVYEHGHWWVTVEDAETGEDQIFDVVDSEPSIANTGLDFEPV